MTDIDEGRQSERPSLELTSAIREVDTATGQQTTTSEVASEQKGSSTGPDEVIELAQQGDRTSARNPDEELEDFVLGELHKLAKACHSKHRQPPMSTIRANLERLAKRVQRGELPADAEIQTRARSSPPSIDKTTF